MSNITLPTKNRPIEVFENRLTEQLVHGYGPGKWIPDNLLEELALEKYQTNGKGINKWKGYNN